ncbi:MAG TPA: thiolase family protein [Dehalococcoidia bacterium]|nr:thiolase family protein [Dehalococcoidia bacterium]
MSERVVVLGVGLHPFGRHPEKSIGEMARVAALAAMKDAGVKYTDIQAGFCGHVNQGVGAGLRTFGQVGMTGIPVTNVELACASSSRAAMLAADAISTGLYDMAMIIGVEKMERGLLSGVGGREGGYNERMGIALMPAIYAMWAQRHMHLYGTKREHWARVSEKSHRNGALNPNAQYQKAIGLEDILNSRMIADPITLYECSPTTDGASAVILASEKKARQFTSSPVFMDTWAGATPEYHKGEAEQAEGPVEKLAHRVYEKAGIGPEDVNVAQVHDAFSPGEILVAEELGFCKTGEGGPYVWEGNTEITGRTPINTDGGLLSRGHPIGATGGAMITELTLQLRGQAGPRQVANPRVALMQNAGIGGVNVIAFKR